MNTPAWIYLLLTLSIFHTLFSVSITLFEQVNTGWKVRLLTKTIQNIISKYILHENVICADRHQITKKDKKIK